MSKNSEAPPVDLPTKLVLIGATVVDARKRDVLPLMRHAFAVARTVRVDHDDVKIINAVVSHMVYAYNMLRSECVAGGKLHQDKVIVNNVELIAKLKTIRDKANNVPGDEVNTVVFDLDQAIDDLENLHLDTHGQRATAS